MIRIGWSRVCGWCRDRMYRIIYKQNRRRWP